MTRSSAAARAEAPAFPIERLIENIPDAHRDREVGNRSIQEILDELAGNHVGWPVTVCVSYVIEEVADLADYLAALQRAFGGWVTIVSDGLMPEGGKFRQAWTFRRRM